ncbi:Rhodanese-like domain-containing protein [Trichinella pseudospiralis]
MKQFDCNKKDIFFKICFTPIFYLLISVQHFSIHTVVTGDICLLTCLQKFVEKMNPESSNSLPSSSSEYDAVNVTNIQSAKGSENLQPNLRHVCRVFTSFKSCTNSCSSPVAMNVLQNGFVGFNFICIERQEEFFEYAPCLEEKEAVISRMCKNELRLSELAFHSLQHMMNSKSTHRETILLDFCRNTSLIVMCVLPATRAECGYGSADLMREFIALTFRNIYEFLETFPNVNTDDHNSCYLLMRLLTTFDLNEKVLPTGLEEQATPINLCFLLRFSSSSYMLMIIFIHTCNLAFKKNNKCKHEIKRIMAIVRRVKVIRQRSSLMEANFFVKWSENVR